MFLFRRCSLLDAARGELREGVDILVEGDRFKEVSDRPIKSADATVVDVGGRTVMPGLIDAHIHVYLSEVNLQLLDAVPLTLMAGRAATLMRAMIDRGFTTVRDTGGADWGIREAVESGHLAGPRLFIAGQGITQTGGHGDLRNRTEPNDPLDSLQFTVEEIRAAVGEARSWKRYVCAHAYGADAIARAVECGVRSIEHGNLIDAPTAKLMHERGAFIVPTLVAYDAMKRRGAEFGLPAVSREKNVIVLEAGLRSLEICKAAGVEIGFGSDLLGQLQVDQSREFLIRAEALSPAEIIRSATIVNARLLQREGELGVIAPGAYADLLIVDGNPLKDIGLLTEQGAHLPAIMKGGRFHKNALAR